jgi:DNA-binding transcriptional regulator YiaG
MIMEPLETMRVRLTPDGRMTRRDAATYLGISETTLRDWAWKSNAKKHDASAFPPIVKVGGRVFYRLSDLQKFVGSDAA